MVLWPQGQEVQVTRRLNLSLGRSSFPQCLAFQALATVRSVQGVADFQQLLDFSLRGYIKPR